MLYLPGIRSTLFGSDCGDAIAVISVVIVFREFRQMQQYMKSHRTETNNIPYSKGHTFNI